MKQPAYRYKATITRVVDGDTVDAEIDLGFRTTSHQRLRLADIDAPETYGVKHTSEEYKAGKLATEFLERTILHEQVIVETMKTGKYGRWLATIYTANSNTSINEVMIQNKLVSRY